MFGILLQIAAAWGYTHVLEYVLHRYVLHGRGRKRKSLLSFHWRDHHRNARKNQMREHFCKREALSVVLLLLAHAPLAYFFPPFYAALWISALHYIYAHNRSHMDVEWGMKHMPWHYAHHMGRNQNANWGVRSAWLDKLFGSSVDMSGDPCDYSQERDTLSC